MSDHAHTIQDSLVRLQGWLKPGTMKWSRDGLDALAELQTEHRAALAARDEENHALREAVRVYVSEVARAAEWLALMPDPEQGYDPTVVSALEYMGRLDPGHDEDSEVAQAILTLRAALAVSWPAQTDTEETRA